MSKTRSSSILLLFLSHIFLNVRVDLVNYRYMNRKKNTARIFIKMITDVRNM